jgi:signal transduction histidine kinase
MPPLDERAGNERDDEVSLIEHLIHDLKNPLGVVLGYAEAMVLADADEQPELCARLAVNARVMLEVLEEYSLLDAARQGCITLEPTACDWPSLAGRVIKDSAASAAEREQQITCRATGPIVLRADSHRLQQTLRLLVREALRSAPRGACLQLAAQPIEGAVELVLEVPVAIVATAAGAAQARQVFDRGRPAIELAERLIALHGGSLAFADDAGRAIVRVRLPVVPAGRRSRSSAGRESE